MDRVKFSNFNWRRWFPVEVAKFLRTPLETQNRFVENLRTGARVKCYLKIVDFVIISHNCRLRVFVKEVMIILW